MIMPPTLNVMKTWTGRTGHDQLRFFVTFWLEKNVHKTSKWSKPARESHDIAWEFGANRRYTGRLLIDGEIYTPSEATRGFCRRKADSRGTERIRLSLLPTSESHATLARCGPHTPVARTQE